MTLMAASRAAIRSMGPHRCNEHCASEIALKQALLTGDLMKILPAAKAFEKGWDYGGTETYEVWQLRHVIAKLEQEQRK